MTREEQLKFYIQLLEREVEALRSVLSEYGHDHSSFVMWQKAEAIDKLKTVLVRP